VTDATTGVRTLKTDFPYADIRQSSTTKLSVDVLLTQLADQQLYDFWYSGYTSYSKARRNLDY